MRIRSTKPEFWRSETIASLDWDVRLVLKGLESYVDDNGVGKDSPVLVCADVFPHDLARDPGTLARITGALQRLAEANLIVRYASEGQPLLYVRRWKSIQRIDRPTNGRYPRPDGSMDYRDDVDETVGAGQGVSAPPVVESRREDAANAREDYTNPRADCASGTGEQGNRGTEEQRKEPAPRTRGARLPDDWRPADELREQMHAERPDIDQDSELLVFHDYWKAQPGQRGVKTDWDATYRNWIRRAKPSRNTTATPSGPSRADQKVQGWLNLGKSPTNSKELT